MEEEGDMEVVEKRWPTIIKKEIETSRVQDDAFLLGTRRRMMAKASFLKCAACRACDESMRHLLTDARCWERGE